METRIQARRADAQDNHGGSVVGTLVDEHEIGLTADRSGVQTTEQVHHDRRTLTGRRAPLRQSCYVLRNAVSSRGPLHAQTLPSCIHRPTPSSQLDQQMYDRVFHSRELLVRCLQNKQRSTD